MRPRPSKSQTGEVNREQREGVAVPMASSEMHPLLEQGERTNCGSWSSRKIEWLGEISGSDA